MKSDESDSERVGKVSRKFFLKCNMLFCFKILQSVGGRIRRSDGCGRFNATSWEAADRASQSSIHEDGAVQNIFYDFNNKFTVNFASTSMKVLLE